MEVLPEQRPLLDSAKVYARGIAGGLLFSIPLLYTMEAWWTGLMVDPLRLLIYVLAGFLLLLGYNYYAGIHDDTTFLEEVMDAVEELGLGLIVAALVLWLIDRITPEMNFNEAVGQVVVESVIIAIGISVGKRQLGGGSDDGKQSQGQKDQRKGDQGQGKQDQGQQGQQHQPSITGQFVIALCGAVLVSANVAPTEEIVVIAAAIPPWKAPILALLSIAVGTGILYYSNFAGGQAVRSPDSWVDVCLGAAAMYASALIASAFFLWFFGRFDEASLAMALAETVVLGVAGALGASAGRLLLQA